MSEAFETRPDDAQQDGVRERHESKYFWLIDESAEKPSEAYVKARYKDTVSLRGER